MAGSCAARKRRSVPMELPASGTVRALGTWVRMKASVVSGLLEGDRGGGDVGQESALRVHGPDEVVHGIELGPGWPDTTRSGPSATSLRSSSVISVAISTITCRSTSSPVISRSIHTSTSVTLSAGRATAVSPAPSWSWAGHMEESAHAVSTPVRPGRFCKNAASHERF